MLAQKRALWFHHKARLILASPMANKVKFVFRLWVVRTKIDLKVSGKIDIIVKTRNFGKFFRM